MRKEGRPSYIHISLYLSKIKNPVFNNEGPRLKALGVRLKKLSLTTYGVAS
jgi:hypothetical protein